ncbi:MAG TPA: SDR family oxidoreductase [Candidatus Acidoferrales bacterium]|nr:SDR family oxidoreductase [Candidatus Acidoferrales bacterium]
MKPFTGKVAIVTGASRGIGRAIARELSAGGCRVSLAARSEDRLSEAKTEIEAAGGECLAVPTDLTRDGDARRLVEATLGRWGTIDYLVNNAGWGKKAPLIKARVEDWDETFRVNLRAPMLLAQLVLPTMIAKGAGAIVNIGSISGKTGQANVAAYSASKFGLIGFTESLFEEVREYGIKVCAIHPGYVDTPLIPQSAPLNRQKMIRPEDVARAVVFVLTSSPTCCPTDITIRPQKSPYL